MVATDLLAQQGVVLVSSLVMKQGWAFRDTTVIDQGIDGQIETGAAGVLNGRLLSVQVKTGESYFKKRTRHGWQYRATKRHAAYWSQSSLPVILVLVDFERDDAFWQEVTPATMRPTSKGFIIDVPESQSLKRDQAWRTLRDLAAWNVDSTQLEQEMQQLPPVAAARLRLAAAFDLRSTSRLASLMAGSDDPSAFTDALLTDPPHWLRPHAAPLWFAIAGFAEEHELWAAACQALQIIGTGRDGAAADRANVRLASLQMTTDPQRSRAALDRLSEEAAGGLWARLLRQWAADPDHGGETFNGGDLSTVEASTDLNILTMRAEFASRAGDRVNAVRYAEEALRLAPLSSPLMRMMAQFLLARSRTVHAERTDLTRACELLQAAVDQRRSWRGDTSGYLDLLARLYGLSGRNDAVLKLCCAAPIGAASPGETRRPEIAQMAMAAAMNLRRDELRESILGAVADRDAAHRVDMIFQRGDAAKPFEMYWVDQLWSAIDARNIEVAFDTVQELAWIGRNHTAALAPFVKEGILEAKLVEIVDAHADAVGGVPGGKARLRKLARERLEAAETLAILHQRAGEFDRVCTVAREAASHFDTVELIDLEVQALLALNRVDEAASVASDALQGQRAAPEIRPILHRALARQAAVRSDWVAAERHFVNSRAEEPVLAVEDAWNLVLVRLRLFRYDQAVAVINEDGLIPSTAAQAELWLSAKMASEWTTSDARIAIGAAEAHPDASVAPELAFNVLLRVDVDVPELTETEPGRNETWAERLSTLIAQQASPEADAQLRTVTDLTEELSQSKQQAEAGLERRRAVQQTLRLQAPLGLMAQVEGAPYASYFDRKPLGSYPVGSGDNDLHREEVATAEAALDQTVVVDVSALIVTNRLGRFDELRSLFASASVTPSAVHDLFAAANTSRLDARQNGSIAFDHLHSELVRIDNDDVSRARLRADASFYSGIARALDVDTRAITVTGLLPNEPAAPWTDALNLAAQRDVTLWSDDAGQRNIARGLGISAFGTDTLLEAAANGNLLPLDEPVSTDPHRTGRMELLRLGASGIYADFADIRAVAEEEHWSGAVAAVALSRSSWWTQTKKPFGVLQYALRLAATHGGADALGRWESCASDGIAPLTVGQRTDPATNIAMIMLMSWAVDDTNDRVPAMLGRARAMAWIHDVDDPATHLTAAAELLAGARLATNYRPHALSLAKVIAGQGL